MARVEPLGKAAAARFDHLPPEVVAWAKVKVARGLPRQADAMTLGRTIYVRPGHEQSQSLLAHELVHVRQMTSARRGKNEDRERERRVHQIIDFSFASLM